jgi:hypothetical protein
MQRCRFLAFDDPTTDGLAGLGIERPGQAKARTFGIVAGPASLCCLPSEGIIILYAFVP